MGGQLKREPGTGKPAGPAAQAAAGTAVEGSAPAGVVERPVEQGVIADAAKTIREFNDIVGNGVKKRMSMFSLRQTPERNRLIDIVYCAFLDQGALGKASIGALNSLLKAAKKLAALADLMEGGKRTSPYQTLDTFLGNAVGEERKRKTDEYYLSEQSISPEQVEKFKKQCGRVSTAVAPRKGSVHIDDVVRVCIDAGFKGENLVKAVAIAKAESSRGLPGEWYNPNCRYATSREVSLGLFQINSMVHHQFDKEQLYDPSYNAEAAYALSGGRNFQPWSVYNDGKYRQFLSLARAAVSRVQSTAA